MLKPGIKTAAMTELQRLLSAYDQQLKTGQPCALATVVQVEGSAYRRPGARMLIRDDGQLTGTISGGCLEGDARRRAQQVMMRGKPEIVVYDSMDLDDDLEHGAQLGCQGLIHVLIEPLRYDAVNAMELLRETTRQQKPAMLLTVLKGSIDGKPAIGLRLLIKKDGIDGLLTQNNALQKKIIADAETLLKQGQSAINQYADLGEEIIIFHERIDPAPQLTVYGAGNDAQPLVRMAYNLGWRVSVIDGRPGLVTAVRFPEAENAQCIRVDDLDSGIPAEGHAVLMSHNYFYDLGVLQQLCKLTRVNYIGLLGPRKKADRLLDDLRKDGYSPETALLHRLFGPVGIDIGAEAAEEIAVAIMAELIAVRNGHPAGFLRDLDGPIHKTELKVPQDVSRV